MQQYAVIITNPQKYHLGALVAISQDRLLTLMFTFYISVDVMQCDTIQFHSASHLINCLFVYVLCALYLLNCTADWLAFCCWNCCWSDYFFGNLPMGIFVFCCSFFFSWFSIWFHVFTVKKKTLSFVELKMIIEEGNDLILMLLYASCIIMLFCFSIVSINSRFAFNNISGVRSTKCWIIYLNTNKRCRSEY